MFQNCRTNPSSDLYFLTNNNFDVKKFPNNEVFDVGLLERSVGSYISSKCHQGNLWRHCHLIRNKCY